MPASQRRARATRSPSILDVPKKINRHVLKALSQLTNGNPNESASTNEIFKLVRYQMRNLVPVFNLKYHVSRSLTNMSTLRIIQKRGHSQFSMICVDEIEYDLKDNSDLDVGRSGGDNDSNNDSGEESDQPSLQKALDTVEKIPETLDIDMATIEKNKEKLSQETEIVVATGSLSNTQDSDDTPVEDQPSTSSGAEPFKLVKPFLMDFASALTNLPKIGPTFSMLDVENNSII